ncbi:MAG TPA: hypothetical protein VES97_09160, partial [Solirubrobacteraceae bacterium]|nr:hypothetical protein [Solirubrobacteraceae bacterium]
MRLAGVSALLTFVILCAFAVAIGSLTVHRIRNDFNREVADTARQLPSEMTVTVNPLVINPGLKLLATEEHAVIRILALPGNVVAQYPLRAPSFGPPRPEVRTVKGYRVITRPLPVY